MDKNQKNQVLEILDYWKTIEFLGQIDLPADTTDNKKTIEKIDKGEKVSEKQIRIFTEITSAQLDLQKQIEAENEKYSGFPSTSDKIAMVLGRIERNAYAAYLEKFLTKRPESPELSYPKNSTFAWFSLSADLEGMYQKNTFRFSPLLWALSV